MAGETFGGPGFKVSNASWAATGFFVLLFLMFAALSSGALPTSMLPAIAYVALAFHLLMFPVVGALPAPMWARMAGFGWLTLDTADNGMELNGVPASITFPLRLGAHLLFATFLVGNAMEAKGVIRPVAVLAAIALFGYTLVASSVPGYGLMPAFILLIVWLVLASRWLASHEGGFAAPDAATRLARG